jgi:hypothetical protein
LTAVEDGADGVCGFQNFEFLDADIKSNQPTSAKVLFLNEQTETVESQVEDGTVFIRLSIFRRVCGGSAVEVVRCCYGRKQKVREGSSVYVFDR